MQKKASSVHFAIFGYEDQPYFSDLINDQEGYSFFYAGQMSFHKELYEYLHVLKTNNEVTDKKKSMLVVSDREDISLKEVELAMYSSSSEVIESIGRHKIVVFNYKN